MQQILIIAAACLASSSATVLAMKMAPDGKIRLETQSIEFTKGEERVSVKLKAHPSKKTLYELRSDFEERGWQFHDMSPDYMILGYANWKFSHRCRPGSFLCEAQL